MFKISASELGTVNMCRRIRACVNKFPATVTEGVHGVCKIGTRASFSVTWRHKLSVGKWIFRHCYKVAYEPRMVVEGQGCSAQHL